MKFVLGVLLLFMSGCSLAENKGIEEAKDYIDQVHEVGLADYEFEGRLESFYESEPIGNEELNKLYDGGFPEGERNPKKLRIHWKDARELALVELELQRLFQKNWNDAGVSERPVLILDRDGGDFYRYYEYRIVKDNKFLGAIRIPAYRRTENFATAEVHFYSADEKTYTVRPTGWGRYMAENSSLDIFSEFIQRIEYSHNINKNFIYTIILEYLSKKFELPSQSLPGIPNNMAQESMNSMITAFEKNNEAVNELKVRHKGDELPNSIHSKAKDYYKRKNITQYEEGIKKYAQVMAKYDTLINIMNDSELDKNNKMNADQFFAASYLEFIKGYVQLMASSSEQDILTKLLRNFYWIKLEKLAYNSDKALRQKYSVDELVKDNNIFPYVVRASFEHTEFLQDKNIVDLLITIIPQKIGFTINNQNYTLMTFIPPENIATKDRDQVLNFLRDNLAKISQNIYDTLNKHNTDVKNQIFNTILQLVTETLNLKPPFTQLGNDLKKLVNSPIVKSIIKTYSQGAVSSLLKNIDIADSFVKNIVPITSGCVKLSIINKNLQANGIEKLSEKDGRDIWFLQRMCAILGVVSLQDIMDFDSKKPIDSLIKLMGPLLKTYMESIYYAMSRSCDRWNIPPTVSLPGTTGDINDIIRQYGIITIEGYAINLADLYHVNMEGTLGALHHSWTGISDPKFTPIKTSFISTRGAYCYWRYAWPKARYSWPTYTVW